MTSGLAWLNELMTWLGRWFPRLVLIEMTHRGVLFGPNGSVRHVNPGLLVYWPITHQLVQMAMTTQSMQLSGQAMWDKQTKETRLVNGCIVCSVAVQFRVVDAVKAATLVLKVHALIDNRAQAAIAKHMTDDSGMWIQSARTELADALTPYGVALERLDFTQVSHGVAVKQIETGYWQDNQNGQRAE